VDGAANEELVRFLAAILDVPRKAISITSGHLGRTKVVGIRGLSPGELALRLEIPRGEHP
jgi:uncharacterized protein YggU (UPF0235/DUF167 family)